MVSLKEAKWQSEYPMDFYAYDSLGNWTVNNKENRNMPVQRAKIKIEYDNNEKK